MRYDWPMRTISAFAPDDEINPRADLRLDARGDLEVVSEREDVRQRVIERLAFWRGEWFLDARQGVPYLTEIFTRPASADLAESVITAEIRSVEGVTDVTEVEVSIDTDTRRLSYAARVSTAYGTAEVTL